VVDSLMNRAIRGIHIPMDISANLTIPLIFTCKTLAINYAPLYIAMALSMFMIMIMRLHACFIKHKTILLFACVGLTLRRCFQITYPRKC